MLARAFSRRVDRDFQVGWRDVWVTPVGLERVRRDPAAVLQLMSIANQFDKPIDHHTWRAIRSAMLNRQADEITTRGHLALHAVVGPTQASGGYATAIA